MWCHYRNWEDHFRVHLALRNNLEMPVDLLVTLLRSKLKSSYLEPNMLVYR